MEVKLFLDRISKIKKINNYVLITKNTVEPCTFCLMQCCDIDLLKFLAINLLRFVANEHDKDIYST